MQPHPFTLLYQYDLDELLNLAEREGLLRNPRRTDAGVVVDVGGRDVCLDFERAPFYVRGLVHAWAIKGGTIGPPTT